MAIWVTRMYHLPSERPEVVLPMLAVDDNDGFGLYVRVKSLVLHQCKHVEAHVCRHQLPQWQLLTQAPYHLPHALPQTGDFLRGQFFVRVENTLS